MIENSNWEEKALFRKQNQNWLNYSRNIALQLCLYKRKHKLTKQMLMDTLCVDICEINNILKGDKNFTLKEIADIQDKLNITLNITPL